MRGKLETLHDVLAAIRITPAHAGKTVRLSVSLPPSPDHPRACGENKTELDAEVLMLGSPPRMRGKPHIRVFRHETGRITPACAGKSSVDQKAAGVITDHPRVCGENCFSSTKVSISAGSPPRVRGKHQIKAFQMQACRITPACAGKTST